MSLPTYEIHAIKYAWRDAKRTNHFVGGDPHDASMPMDYFVWLVRNAERTIVIDTGFNQAMADKRKRVFIRQPAEGLALLSAASDVYKRHELAPGISIHHIGGHTMGLQCVRVHTARGWVVVASDTSHYYEHFEQGRVFATTFHLGQTLDGYARLKQLADSVKHIVPGHDPLVMERYPASSPALKGIAVRLDEEPND